MTNPFLGQIELVGFGYAPCGWVPCDGQLLPVPQNTAMFSLLGTAFGGDGRATFALPDLRGRFATHVGSDNLTTFSWGERGGHEDIHLNEAHLPSHNHTLFIQRSVGNVRNAADALLARDSGKDFITWDTNTSKPKKLVATNYGNIGSSGDGKVVDYRDVYLGLQFNVATQGIFPSRS